MRSKTSGSISETPSMTSPTLRRNPVPHLLMAKHYFSPLVKPTSSHVPPRSSIPGANDGIRALASAYSSSRENLLSVPDPSAAQYTTAAPVTLSPSFTIAARSPMPSGSRAPSSRAPAVGSPALAACSMDDTLSGRHPANSR